MSGSWKEMSLEYKRKQAEDPQEPRPKKGRYNGVRTKGRKQRMDVLTQASKDFFEHIDRIEDDRASAANCDWAAAGHKRGPYMCWHGWRDDPRWTKTLLTKYLAALKACVDAGDVPPPSWYGTSR